MAYGFGSGVQAGLGATDYYNYLRGALAGAQMQAEGGAAIGQGIASALGSVGGGLQQLGQYAAKGEERIRKEKSSIQSAKFLARALATNDKLPESMNYLKGVAYSKLKDLDNPYLEDREKFATAEAVNSTLRDLLGIGIASAQIAESEARTIGKGLVTSALNAYNGIPTAATTTATPEYGAGQTTPTEGPLPQPQVQGQVNDPFAKRDRGLASAGTNPDAIRAVEDTFNNELGVLVPQAVASILQDINGGGTGDAVPAGTSDGVYNLAIQEPRVDAALKESRTKERDNKIANVVQAIGSGGALTGLDNLSAADQLEAVKQVREFYPQSDMEVFDFGGIQMLRVGSNVTTFGGGQKKVIDPKKFTEATEVVYSVARETGFNDYSKLPQELKVVVNEAFLNALTAGGRNSVGDKFLEDIQTFYSQAAESIAGNETPGVTDAEQSQQSKTATKLPAATQLQPVQPAAAADADRPGIEQGFFRAPSYSDPIRVTNITEAPKAPGEPPPGQFSTKGLTAPPIETSVSATGEPWTGAADDGAAFDAGSIASKAVTGATILEAARRAALRAFNNSSVKIPAQAATRLAGAKAKDATKRVIEQSLKTLGKTTLRRAGPIAAVTVAVDDILGMGATFIANQVRKSEGQELRDYNTGLIELTMEKLGELSVDPRGKQIIKGQILDQIESIQRSRVNNRDADAAKNAQIRYLLELSQTLDKEKFRSGEWKKYSG